MLARGSSEVTIRWRRHPHRDGSIDAETRSALDEAFRLLASPTRRAVCRVLRGTAGESIDLETLADAVLDADERDLDRTEVAVSLVHQHLPALGGADVVDYRPTERTVRYHGGQTVETLFGAADTLVADGADSRRGPPTDIQ